MLSKVAKLFFMPTRSDVALFSVKVIVSYFFINTLCTKKYETKYKYSAPSSPEFKNEWSYYITPTIRLQYLYGNNFTNAWLDTSRRHITVVGNLASFVLALTTQIWLSPTAKYPETKSLFISHLRPYVLSWIILDISFVTPWGCAKYGLCCLQGSDQAARATKVSWLVTILKRNLLVLYYYLISFQIT